jgi:hypothetical protein
MCQPSMQAKAAALCVDGAAKQQLRGGVHFSASGQMATLTGWGPGFSRHARMMARSLATNNTARRQTLQC